MLQSGHGMRDGRTDGRMDGQTDRRTDGRTEWNQYTPQQLRCSGGIISIHINRDPCIWFIQTEQIQLAAVSVLCTFNSSPTGQNGRHFPDDIFKCIFMNEKCFILIQISLKFVPKFLINNISSLVQIMAWRQSGDKPLSGTMLTQFTDAYMWH